MALPPVARFDFSRFVQGQLCMSYKCLFACEAPLLKDTNLCEFLVEMDKREYQIISLENEELLAEQTANRNAIQTAKQATDQAHERVQKTWGFYSGIAKYTSFALGLIVLLASFHYARKSTVTQEKCNALFKVWDLYNKEHKKEREIDYNAFDEKRKTVFPIWPFDLGNAAARYKEHAETLSNGAMGLGIMGVVFYGVQWLLKIAPRSFVVDTQIGKDCEISKNRQLRILDKIRTLENRVKLIHDDNEIQQLSRVSDYFRTFWNFNQSNAVIVRHV